MSNFTDVVPEMNPWAVFRKAVGGIGLLKAAGLGREEGGRGMARRVLRGWAHSLVERAAVSCVGSRQHS